MLTKKPVKIINKKKTFKKSTNHKLNFEKTIDNVMWYLQKKFTFVDKLIGSDFLKKILSLKIVKDTNKSIRTNLHTTSKVIWWILVVFGAIWFLTILSTIWAIWFLVTYMWWRFVILLLLNLVYVIFWLLLGFGLIKMKKRVPFFITLVVLAGLAYMLIALVLSSISAIPSPWVILFYIIFTVYILNNKDLFNK